MNERQTTSSSKRNDEIPSYLTRYAAEVDAWAIAARSGRR